MIPLRKPLRKCTDYLSRSLKSDIKITMFQYRMIATKMCFLGRVYMEGRCPANRATRLERLTHSPPLHATRTVSGLRGLSFERPLSTTN